MKRFVDIVISIMLLILFSPVIIFVYVLIRIFIGCPVLFCQERPGRDEDIFTLFKFRTMHDLYDEDGNLLPDNERLTSFGSVIRRLSIDELPQLVNVLLGDMSLVGPRPLLVEYLPLYNERQSRRHEVRPGITGWAQVNGRNKLSWQQRFELDVWYVENVSLWLDFKILILTVFNVFRNSNINHPGHITMPKFSGNDDD